MKTKTAGRIKGSVFLRGKTWWLSYSTGERIETGSYRRIAVSLGTGDEQEARKKAESYLIPLSYKDEAKRASAISEAARTVEEKSLAVALEATAQRNRIALVDAWKKFPYDHTSPRHKNRWKLSPTTIEQNFCGWGKFVRWMDAFHPEIKFLEEVTANHANEFSRHLTETEHLTAGRHNKCITICRVIFKLTGRRSPFDGIRPEAGYHESKANLEAPELVKVISHATGELRRLFVVATYTGMRLGDCVLLKWSSIHNGKIFKTGADRTKKTGRELVLPLAPNLAAELSAVPVEERGEYVCPELADIYVNRRTHLSQLISEHFKRCGLITTEAGQNRKFRISRRGFHSFRHSFITECARRGVPIGAIRDWVGHSSTQITTIYEHHGHQAGHDQILAALPALVGAFIGASAAVESVSADQLRRRITKAMKTANHGALERALVALEDTP